MKNNKKGFTLVELLVAITILGIILVIALPQISSLQRDNATKKYEKYAESVVTSAKLYTDSYSKDMFGNNSSGCYDVQYSKLEAKGLAKDIKVDNSTCNTYAADGTTALTFVRVYKSNDNYLYDIAITCKDKNGNEVYKTELNGDICDGTTTDTQGPTITISENSNWTTGKDTSGNPLKATITISDPYGLKENVKVEYAWTKTPDNISGLTFTEKAFTNGRGSEAEQTLTFKVNYPQNKNGYWYLIVRPAGENGLRDSNGNFYTDSYTKSDAFKLDTTPPTIDETTNSSKDTWTSDPVTITATASDALDGVVLSGIKKVYYSYNSDGSSPKNTWNTSFTVGASPVTVSKTFSTQMNHTIYIIAEDQAGNKSPITNAGKVLIDNSAPTCESSGGSDDWTSGNIKLVGKCTDGESDCTNVEKTYSSDINSTTESPGQVCDSAGNCTTCPANQTVKIDKTPPTTPTSGAIGKVSGPSKTGKIATSASGSKDTGSGILEYRYLVTNSSTTPTDKTKFTTSVEYPRACGTSYYAWAVAVDKVGNISAIKSLGNTSDGKNSYGEWSACTKVCGSGTQTRSNSCDLITTGLSQSCNTQDCCSSTTISSYGDWSSCSKKCGGGTKTRDVYLVSAYDSSISCGTSSTKDSESCNTQDCCSSTTTSGYGDWSSCSKKCGGGTKTRDIYLVSAYDSSVSCGTSSTQDQESCNTQDCCSSTTTSGYGEWSACSKKCGGGTKTRDIYLVSSYDSSVSCGTSSTKDSGTCNTQDCCSSTTISGYGSWGACSVTCGGGKRYRDIYLVSSYDSNISCGTSSTQDQESCNTAACSCTHSYGNYITEKSENYVNYYCTKLDESKSWSGCKASDCTGSHTLAAGKTLCQLQCIHCGYRKTTKWCPNTYYLLP